MLSSTNFCKSSQSKSVSQNRKKKTRNRQTIRTIFILLDPGRRETGRPAPQPGRQAGYPKTHPVESVFRATPLQYMATPINYIDFDKFSVFDPKLWPPTLARTFACKRKKRFIHSKTSRGHKVSTPFWPAVGPNRPMLARTHLCY